MICHFILFLLWIIDCGVVNLNLFLEWETTRTLEIVEREREKRVLELEERAEDFLQRICYWDQQTKKQEAHTVLFAVRIHINDTHVNFVDRVNKRKLRWWSTFLLFLEMKEKSYKLVRDERNQVQNEANAYRERMKCDLWHNQKS